MAPRTRILLLGLLLLGVGLAALLSHAPSDDHAKPPTDRDSTSGGAGEPLTLHGLAAADRPPTSPASVQTSAPPPGYYVLDSSGIPPLFKAPSTAATTPTMMVRGRLIDPDGSPARAATIAVRPMRDPNGTSMAPSVGWLRGSKEDGRFELACPATRHLRVDVCSEHSAPQQLERSVADSEVVDLGDIQLEAGAALEGHVLFGGKANPFGPAEVWVSPRQSSSNVGFGVGARRSVSFDGTGAFEVLHAKTTTDASGAWRVEGLPSGAYRVLLAGVEQMFFHQSLGPAQGREVTAPASEVDFDLDVSLLRVTAGSEDAPFGVDFDRLDVTDAAGRLMSVTQQRQLGRMGRWPPDDDVRYLLVPANAPFDVRVQCSGHAAWRRRVHSAAAGETLELAASVERAATGKLILTLPPGRRHPDPQLLYTFFDPGTRHVVHTGEAILQPDRPHETSPPLGTWDLELRCLNAHQSRPSRFALPQREPVVIVPDKPSQVAWSPPAGALLRILVSGSPTDLVRCLLLEPGRAERDVLFVQVVELPPEVLSHYQPWPGPLRAGNVHESHEVLAPGPITLRLEADGFEPYERRLVLEPEQVHELTVQLRPR